MSPIDYEGLPPSSLFPPSRSLLFLPEVVHLHSLAVRPSVCLSGHCLRGEGWQGGREAARSHRPTAATIGIR